MRPPPLMRWHYLELLRLALETWWRCRRHILYLLLFLRKFLLVNYLYVVRMGVGWTNWRGLNVLVVLILVILKRTFLHLLLFLRKFLLRKFLLAN